MSETAITCKAWLLSTVNDDSDKLEIQRNDELMLLATDDDAVRRARFEARRGRRFAIEAVAHHQRTKRTVRRWRRYMFGKAIYIGPGTKARCPITSERHGRHSRSGGAS